jgi:hypothetical protein
MTEEEYLALEALTQARAVCRILETTDVPELIEARLFASRAAIRLTEAVKVHE